MKSLDLLDGEWLNKPKISQLTPDALTITTEPNTDFWQRSYYGFRNENAPALLFKATDNFTFSARASFEYKAQFDQCGLLLFIDNENWFKASVEYENPRYSRLGSVVTNLGHSDWATTDIAAPNSIVFRLSRRGSDFLIESSTQGDDFKQMRIFHLHQLGATTAEMGSANPPIPATNSVRFGLYACSPGNSSFKARFSKCWIGACSWNAHT